MSSRDATTKDGICTALSIGPTYSTINKTYSASWAVNVTSLTHATSPVTSLNTRMADTVEELQHPREAKRHFLAYLRDEILTLNFYRAHMLYFVVVIAISSVIVYGEGVANGPKELGQSHLTYMDALFLACSAMTTTGKWLQLAVVSSAA
jgi:hypothetical protein